MPPTPITQADVLAMTTNAAMQAMEWKDEQLIDKLEDWLANNICNAYNFRGDNISSTFINDCIKAMKEEKNYGNTK